MTLDIIIPLCNKEKNILNYYNKVIEELNNIKYSIIFVDDSSTDKTLDILKEIQAKDDEKVKIISLSNNFGKDLAIKAGLDYCKNDLICIFDLDLQANVTHITKMYNFLLEHPNYDSVCMYSNYEEKNIIKKIQTKLFNKIFGLDVDYNKTNYRMFRKNVKEAILKNSTNQFSLYMFELIGFNTYYLKFDNKNHVCNFDTKKMIGFSNKPFNFIKYINLFLIILFIVLLTLRILNVIKIGNCTCLFALILLIILLLYVVNFSLYIVNIKYKKDIYFIKELIGFDDNIL